MLLSALQTLLFLPALAYLAHRIENAYLARSGYDTRNFFKPVIRAETTTKMALWSAEDERRQALSYIENPLAFWLDPNLWGDNPDWREKLLPPQETPAEHYNRIRRQRGLPGNPIDPAKEAENDRLMAEAGIINPKMLYRAVIASEDDSFLPLPCGCPWETTITRMREPYTGWHVTRCNRCMAEWRPPSTDSSGRRLGQGEKVDFPDFKHGVCPAEDCYSPCAYEKRDGFYYCSNSLCANNKRGWSNDGTQWLHTLSGWRKKLTSREITARRKRLDTSHDYDNDPRHTPPRSY